MEKIKEFFLTNQCVDSLDEINKWFQKSHEANWFVHGISEIGDFLKTVNKNTFIRIMGDYDVDGIMSTYILYKLLTDNMGFTNVSYRIPKRHSEGFGLNMTMIEEIKENANGGIIITCDNGIAALEPITYAKDLGFTVIVTDHHQPVLDDNGNIVLPNADFICDPNAIPGKSDFCGYCGAGIAYKLAEYILENNRKILGMYQSVAAVATVADVMELTKENYVLVKEGLKKLMMPYYCTTGLYALVAQCEMSRHCDAHDVGFKLGPCINAMSRLHDDGAMKCLKCLLFNGDMNVAVRNAMYITNNNNDRKEYSKVLNALVHKKLEDNALFGNVPLIIYIEDTTPGNVYRGLIGTVAGNICEEFNTPTLILTDDGDALLGSGRAPEGYNLYENLNKVANDLIRFGGHEGAAGFKVSKDNFDTFETNMLSLSDAWDPEFHKPSIAYDFEIKASEVKSYIEELKLYEPWGQGNKPPTFFVTDVVMLPDSYGYLKCMGINESIVKIRNTYFDGISFNCAKEFKLNPKEHNISIVGTLGENYFNNKCTPQVEFSSVEFNSPINNKKKLHLALEKRAEQKQG